MIDPSEFKHPRDLDDLARRGLCLGSNMKPRSFDLDHNAGMCPHCQRFVTLAGRVVKEHRAADELP